MEQFLGLWVVTINLGLDLLQTLTGHSHHVHDLAFSPDGTQIASASFDQTIHIWDVSSGALLLHL